jgi:TPR repeat protein
VRVRREALPILRSARRGDAVALFEVGRAYLLGRRPFGFHPDTGIRYLKRSVEAGHRPAAHLLTESLTLDQLLAYELVDELRRCAMEGLGAAQIKLGIWLATALASRAEGVGWLRRAERAGHPQARLALANILLEHAMGDPRTEGIRLLRAEAAAGNASAWIPLARAALVADDQALFWLGLRRACEAFPPTNRDVAILVVTALCIDETHIRIALLPPEHVRLALMQRSDQRDADAMLLLGRVLAGLDERLRSHCAIPNTRKLGRAVSLLQAAADAGAAKAWLALAELYGTHPSLPYAARHARYYLERAVQAGAPMARVQLGEQMLAQARCEEDLSRAMQLLQPLARQGLTRATSVLATLISPVAREDGAAHAALTRLAHRYGILASRLSLARQFGLTVHEALTLDLNLAQRPWGLWVDPGPFFSQRRKRMPRAIPALSEAADDALRRAKAMLYGIDCGPAGPEGDYRQRAYALTAALRRIEAPPELFFATLTPRQLESMRGGLAWRRRHANLLLAEAPLSCVPASLRPSTERAVLLDADQAHAF